MHLRPKKPCSQLALITLPIQTEQDGLCYLFLACDAFDGFAYNLGAEQKLDLEILVQAVDQLLNDPSFDPHPGEGFTLVLADFEEFAPQLEAAMEVFNGRVLVNPALHAQIAKPLLDSFAEQFG